MIRIFNHYVPIPNIVLAILDSVLLFVAVYAGLFFRWADVNRPIQEIGSHLSHAIIFVIVVSTMMFAVGLYDRQTWRSWSVVAARVFVSYLLAFLILSLIFYMFPDTAIWRSALVIAILLAVTASLAVRIVYYRLADFDAFKRRVLVLGTGEIAARVAAIEGDERSEGFFHNFGFIQLNGGNVKIAQERIITGVNDLTAYVRKNRIEEIVVAVDDRRGRLPIQALMDCKLGGVTITEFLTFYERETGRVDLGNMNPSWFIFSESQAGQRGYEFAKRIFDVLASIAILIFTLPLSIAVAVAIRIDSDGPAFYRQKRVGLNDRPFDLLKFRTMGVDAEADGVPQWAGNSDSRVTRVGRLLRRTRVDEIPQLINVLKGDMGLVGPRPERPYFVNDLGGKIAFYNERHRIKPGLTGWAQINYRYTDSVDDAKVKTEFDLYYVKNHSMFLDLVIVLQTLRVIIWPDGVH